MELPSIPAVQLVPMNLFVPARASVTSRKASARATLVSVSSRLFSNAAFHCCFSDLLPNCRVFGLLTTHVSLTVRLVRKRGLGAPACRSLWNGRVWGSGQVRHRHWKVHVSYWLHFARSVFTYCDCHQMPGIAAGTGACSPATSASPSAVPRTRSAGTAGALWSLFASSIVCVD